MDVTDYILSAGLVFTVNESDKGRGQGASIPITQYCIVVVATNCTNTNGFLINYYY